MLAPGPGGAENLHFDVRRIQSHIRTFHLRQDRYCHRGGMDPSSRLGLGHPLTRWTPLSNFRREKAPVPSIVKVISFMPPSSVSLAESTSQCHRWLSAYMEYIR